MLASTFCINERLQIAVGGREGKGKVPIDSMIRNSVGKSFTFESHDREIMSCSCLRDHRPSTGPNDHDQQ